MICWIVKFRWLFLVILLGSLSAGLSPKAAVAQTAPFLISPYYREKGINAYFANHGGIDFAIYYEQVLAGANGTVHQVQWYNNNCHQHDTNSSCGYGLHTIVSHDNNYRTIYAHLSATAFSIGATGIALNSGQVIGTSGHTGWSTGPHLHFEVRNSSDQPTDPFSPNLWSDGQWANPSPPIPAPVNGGEILVDDTTNNNGGFSKGSGGALLNACTGDCGGWVSATIGVGSHMYHTPADGGSTVNQWAKWAPPGIPNGGAIYEVFIRQYRY